MKILRKIIEMQNKDIQMYEQKLNDFRTMSDEQKYRESLLYFGKKYHKTKKLLQITWAVILGIIASLLFCYFIQVYL